MSVLTALVPNQINMHSTATDIVSTVLTAKTKSIFRLPESKLNLTLDCIKLIQQTNRLNNSKKTVEIFIQCDLKE